MGGGPSRRSWGRSSGGWPTRPSSERWPLISRKAAYIRKSGRALEEAVEAWNHNGVNNGGSVPYTGSRPLA